MLGQRVKCQKWAISGDGKIQSVPLGEGGSRETEKQANREKIKETRGLLHTHVYGFLTSEHLNYRQRILSLCNCSKLGS